MTGTGRRSFLATLAALMAAPKALLALVGKPKVTRPPVYPWGDTPVPTAWWTAEQSHFRDGELVTSIPDFSGNVNYLTAPPQRAPYFIGRATDPPELIAFDHVLSPEEAARVNRYLASSDTPSVG